MLPIRIKACSESDLRMLGDLAHNIQRVLPVTQADIDAAAALGQGWVVWKVVEVSDPIDNLRGGTQLVIKENSITAGQNVRRVLIVSGPSGQVVVVGPDKSPLLLPDAIADSLQYLKAFGDCENRNLPEGYQELEYIEGNNNLQYINTGIVPTSSMSMYFKGQFVSVDSSTPAQGAFLMGTRDVSGQYGLFLQITTTNVSLDWFAVNSRWSSANTRAVGDVVEMKVSNSLAEIWVNGSSVGTHQYTPDDTTQYPLFLNALNNIGRPFDSNVNVVNRVYRFIIEGIADMRPARRLSDGVLGMYDTIRKRFFTNAGTGTFIAGAVVALPEGYTKLGFLQTTKTPQQCYFDTGKNFNSDYTYEVSFMKGGNANAIMGARVGAYNAKGNFAVTYVAQTAVYSSTSSASTAVDMGDTTLDEKHTVRYCQRDSLLTWDGADKWKSDWINSESIPYNMYLFAMNQANTVQGSRSGYLRIYTYKVYDGNGILIQDLVPAVRNSDNAMGLYDTVADEFLLAKGSSVEFTGSPVYTPTPAAPQDIWCNNGAIKAIRPLEYLESTGTQYIDTGVLPTLNTKLVVKATRIAVGGFAGSRDGADANSTMMAFATNGTSVIIDFNNGNNAPYRINYTIGTGIITIIAESSKDARRLYDENGTLLAENTTVCSDTFTATKNMTLFNCNGGSISGGCRIYYAQIWDGDTLVRDFIPALDSNNIPCLFDKVEGKCYYNAGTGQFVAGYLPAEYEELEYIQGASNVQYINTGIIPNSSMSIYAKVQLMSDTETTASFFFGGRTQSTGGTGVAGMWTPTELVFDWFGSDNADRYSVSATRTTGDVLEYTINNSLVTIKRNGTVAGTHQFTPIGTSTQPLYINGMNNGGTVVLNNSAKARIYRFTVAGVCDMIPARKRSNGHIGMYDLIRRQFFENAGTGNFEYGAEIPDSRESYYCVDGVIEKVGTRSAGNKNLFNGVFEQGALNIGSLIDTNLRIRTPDYIYLPAGTYTVSCASAYEIWVEKNDTTGLPWTDTKTITIANGDRIKIAVRNKANPNTPISVNAPVQVQVEAGSTATAYVPYCDGGLAVCENLLGIGSTQDIQEILTGSITRKVGIKVLTGDEVWFKAPNATSLFGTRLCEGTIETATPGLSTHFFGTTSGNANMADGSIKILTASTAAPGYVSCYIKANLANDNLTTWMTWLRQQYDNGTPVIVVYPLSADETESVAGQTLTVSAGNNTAEIIQASIDDLLLEAKYTKSV